MQQEDKIRRENNPNKLEKQRDKIRQLILRVCLKSYS